MPPLPFTLRMPGQDHSADGLTSWSTFKVRGCLHFDGARLVLEWAVTASTSEVEGLDVRSEVEPLPAEALEVPLDRLRGVEVRSGWWRPRLELVANDLTLFFGVPGEKGGRVRLYLERSDRPDAQAVADAITAALRSIPRASIEPP